jgi:2-polyprenyl-6-methoxyphenol hydroxylase-like FAD-dependent oxidoreductase
MMPYFAQGACMALEDAVCLAHMTATHAGDMAGALAAYRDRRLLRTARVQLQARAIGDHIAHPAGVHALLRNAMMRNQSAEQWLDSLHWLYGGTGLTESSPVGEDVALARSEPVPSAALAT